MAAHDSVDAVKPFDDAAVAELFPARNRKFNRQFTRYGRFDSAAEALRFAIEGLPPLLLPGAFVEVAEERLDGRSEIACSILHRRACGRRPSVASVWRPAPPCACPNGRLTPAAITGARSPLRRLFRTACGAAAAPERGMDIEIAVRSMMHSAMMHSGMVNGSVRSFGCHRKRSCRSTA